MPIRNGIRLVEGFSRLRIVQLASRPPGDIVAIDPTESGVEPDRNNLGTSVELLYVEEADLP